MFRKKTFHIVAVALLLLSAVYIFKSFDFEKNTDTKKEESAFLEQQYPSEKKTVRGTSMTPLLQDGDVVEVFFNYYDSNEIKRNDLILYDYAGNDVPLLKMAKGIPGDRFELVKKDENVWSVLINGEVVKNSEKKEYSFSGKRYDMLSLYEKNFKENIIPENTYLILGDSVSNVTDSSRFGFVHKNDIMGKALLQK